MIVCQAAAAQSTPAPAAQATQESNRQTPNETQQQFEERKKHPFTEAPERMAIAPVPHDVPVAAPLYLDVTMAPGKLKDYSLFRNGQILTWSIYVTEIGPSGEGVERGTGPAKIVS